MIHYLGNRMPRNTFSKFQKQIWDELPERKHLAGQEKVYDIISVVIQEWPVEEYSAAIASDDQLGKMRATRRLMRAVKRHMAVLYGGEQDFGSLWIVFLNIVVSIIIRYIWDWWKNNKTHQKQLLAWRRRWVSQNEAGE